MDALERLAGTDVSPIVIVLAALAVLFFLLTLFYRYRAQRALGGGVPIPAAVAESQAARDVLRAQHAVELRELEVRLEKARAEAHQSRLALSRERDGGDTLSHVEERERAANEALSRQAYELSQLQERFDGVERQLEVAKSEKDEAEAQVAAQKEKLEALEQAAVERDRQLSDAAWAAGGAEIEGGKTVAEVLAAQKGLAEQLAAAEARATDAEMKLAAAATAGTDTDMDVQTAADERVAAAEVARERAEAALAGLEQRLAEAEAARADVEAAKTAAEAAAASALAAGTARGPDFMSTLARAERAEARVAELERAIANRGAELEAGEGLPAGGEPDRLVERLQRKLDAARGRSDELEQDMERLRANLGAAEQRRLEEVAALEDRLATTRRRVVDLEEERDTLRDTAEDAAAARNEEQSAEIARLTAALAAADAGRATAETEREAVAARLAAAEAQSNDDAARSETEATALAEATARTKMLEAEIERLEEAAEEAEATREGERREWQRRLEARDLHSESEIERLKEALTAAEDRAATATRAAAGIGAAVGAAANENATAAGLASTGASAFADERARMLHEIERLRAENAALQSAATRSAEEGASFSALRSRIAELGTELVGRAAEADPAVGKAVADALGEAGADAEAPSVGAPDPTAPSLARRIRNRLSGGAETS